MKNIVDSCTCFIERCPKNGRQKVSIAEIWGAYVLEIDEDGGFRSLRRRAAWSVGLEKEGRLK